MLRQRMAQMISDLEILPTDIIPIVNHAWNESFADIPGNREATVQRGWFPPEQEPSSTSQIEKNDDS